MPIFLTNDKFTGLLRGSWISSPADTSLLVNAIPDNVPSIIVAGYQTDNETVFSFTGTSGTNASNYVLTGVTRLRGANVNLPENTTIHCIAVEEFFNQYAGVASTASGIANLIFGVDSEASDTYAITLDTSPGSYVAGLALYFQANTSNTGAATLNVNGLGAKAIKRFGESGIQDIETNDIQADQIVNVVYDGTQFLLMATKPPVVPVIPEKAFYTLVPDNATFPDSNYPGFSKVAGSNWIYKVLDFDQTTSESVYWNFQVPSHFTSITSCDLKINWTAASGSGTFTASAITRCLANDEVVDATTTPSSASAVTATDTLLATGDLHQFSLGLTVTGWVAGDLIQLKFSRDTADSLSGDVRLISVTVEMTE